MSESIAVIGAGIAGPVAALALESAGYHVTVIERRQESELKSNGILGITNDNYQSLNEYGAHLELVELPNFSTDYATGKTTRNEYRYITWSDLHNSIVRTARKTGVVFQFDKEWPGGAMATEFDRIVYAGGVGMAAANGNTPNYSGYVVIRGLAYGEFAGTAWTSVHGDGPTGQWLFNIGDTRDGASFALYVRRESLVKMATRIEYTAPPEVSLLPTPEFRRLVLMATNYQVSPISDWEVPNSLMSPGRTAFTVGDANGAMRPHTSMGANLGIGEALALPAMMSNHFPSIVENWLLTNRYNEYTRGIELGTEAMGM